MLEYKPKLEAYLHNLKDNLKHDAPIYGQYIKDWILNHKMTVGVIAVASMFAVLAAFVIPIMLFIGAIVSIGGLVSTFSLFTHFHHP